MINLKEKVVLVTGSTDGIGKLAARQLAGMGAKVLLHGRDIAKGEAVTREIRRETDRENVEYYLAYYQADLSSLQDVRRLAEDVMTTHKSVDVLLNNAGVGPGSPQAAGRQLSRDGYELRFAVNFLAPFLLTHLLLPLLRNAAPSRVVNVASAAQKRIDFNDVMLKNDYTGEDAYARSKLAMVMFTFDLAERLKNDRIMVNCLHPGSLLDTKMVRQTSMTPRGKARIGADAEVWLSASPDLEGVTGKYFEEKKQAQAHPQAYDPDSRRSLWRLAERLVEV